MLKVTRLLPDEHDVDSIIHANGQHETERKHIKQIQMNIQQLHRSDHCSDTEHECDHLDEPQAKIAIQNS